MPVLEKESKLNEVKTFKKFEEKIDFFKKNLLMTLEKIDRKICVGYGASASSTTLIHHFELQNYIKYRLANPNYIANPTITETTTETTTVIPLIIIISIVIFIIFILVLIIYFVFKKQ